MIKGDSFRNTHDCSGFHLKQWQTLTAAVYLNCLSTSDNRNATNLHILRS